MTHNWRTHGKKKAQTLVFFLLSFGTIFLLCGLAIDSGLLYLAKARLSRAVDGAALAAVGNFHRADNPTANQVAVAKIMRDFALANFSDLNTTINGVGIPTTADYTSSVDVVTPNGTTKTYTYRFDDGTLDPNGQPRRYVEVVLATGAGGQITSATCNARCPVQTYFIGYAQGIIGGFRGVSSMKDLKVSSSAVASRNPRLIMVVIDRSGSMLSTGGGAYGLPQAVMSFLNFFDTSSDYIGIVSFGSAARLEMPLTTNFLIAATNILIDSYQITTNAFGVYGQPGVDPEMYSSNTDIYESDYANTGVRRLKFGGGTAADEGMRLAAETLMANSAFYNPDVVKYLVLFTDGAWNTTRTLVAAPGYTNVITCDNPAASTTVAILTNTNPDLTNMVNATSMVFLPSLSPQPGYTNAVRQINLMTPNDHTNDVWLSLDSNTTIEPFQGSSTPVGPREGDTAAVTNTTFLGHNLITGKDEYATTLNVWLQPGAIDYVLDSTGNPTKAYIGNLDNPTNTVNIQMAPGEKNMLVVPGYLIDGILYDGLDLCVGNFAEDFLGDDYDYGSYLSYHALRSDNFSIPFMWPDDITPLPTALSYSEPYFSPDNVVQSLMRNLMFRNYANLLTGYYVMRPDDPPGTADEPTTSVTGAPVKRPLHGLGPYYPSAGFYWPFDLVGVDYFPTTSLTNAIIDPDPTDTGLARQSAYSVNMHTAAAQPSWDGELFYSGTNSAISTSNSQSTVISTDAQWQRGRPNFVDRAYITGGGANPTVYSLPTSNTLITPNPKLWKAQDFRGHQLSVNVAGMTPAQLLSVVQGNPSSTGGYVVDNSGHLWNNTMAWSSRPTHYFDFSKSTWVPIATQHQENINMLPLGIWKVREYAWHLRDQGVKIYSVGYGSLVTDDEQVLLAQVANSTNTTAGGGTGTNFLSGNWNTSQPIGEQFFSTNAAQVSNNFFQVGQAINASLTQ